MECKTCYCLKEKSCSKCNNRINIKDGKCIVEPGRFCTCRLCGQATGVVNE